MSSQAGEMAEDLNWMGTPPPSYGEDGEGHQYQSDNREESEEEEGAVEGDDPTMEAAIPIMTKTNPNPKPEAGGPEHKCKICSMTFEDADETRLHYKTVHRKKKVSYMCPICEEEFAKSIFQIHFKNAHMEPPVKRRRKTKAGPHEDVPGPAVVALPLAIPPPQPKPLGKGNFSCNLCGHLFPNESKLKRHFLEVHLQLKKNECELCGKNFGRRSHLTRHRREVHHV